jgi:hypothetical protein
MTMDAIASMATTIQRITAQQTPEERRRARNRRYYEQNREAVIQWMRLYRRLCVLRELAPLFTKPPAS